MFAQTTIEFEVAIAARSAAVDALPDGLSSNHPAVAMLDRIESEISRAADRLAIAEISTPDDLKAAARVLAVMVESEWDAAAALAGRLADALGNLRP